MVHGASEYSPAAFSTLFDKDSSTLDLPHLVKADGQLLFKDANSIPAYTTFQKFLTTAVKPGISYKAVAAQLSAELAVSALNVYTGRLQLISMVATPLVTASGYSTLHQIMVDADKLLAPEMTVRRFRARAATWNTKSLTLMGYKAILSLVNTLGRVAETCN